MSAAARSRSVALIAVAVLLCFIGAADATCGGDADSCQIEAETPGRKKQYPLLGKVPTFYFHQTLNENPSMNTFSNEQVRVNIAFVAKRKSTPMVTTYSHKLVQRLSGHRAVDLVLVVSAAYTQSDHHSWLQSTIQQLDAKLRSLNIGAETSSPNRYALLQFGGRGFYSRASFVTLPEGLFFPITSLPVAVRQLQSLGAIADGYYALEYAAMHAPFRNDTHTAKMMLLVVNKERNNLLTQSTLTKSQVSDILTSNHIMLDLAADVHLTVASETGTVAVFGLNGQNRGITVSDNGTFRTYLGTSTLATPVSIYNDYASLVTDTEGVTFSLETLSSRNTSAIASFLSALVFEHSLQGIEQVQVCERCHCGQHSPMDQTCGRVTCEAHSNQSLCTCLVQNTLPVCDGSAVATEPPPVPTPIITIIITGTLSVNDKDVKVTFTSTKRRASYECILIDGTTLSPKITRCSSPYYIKNVVSGRHKLVLMARRKNAYGSKVFDFSVGTTEEEGDRLTLSMTHKSNTTNGSVMVTMTVGNAGKEDWSGVALVCSIAGRPFLPCSSPHYLTAREIPLNIVGTPFVVSALSSDRRPAIAIANIKKPVRPTGPVKIQLVAIEPPDPLGRITVKFNTTRPDVRCFCRVNISHPTCVDHYVADPRILGAGPKNLTIICMDFTGFVDTQRFKLFLPHPPQPQVYGPIGCNMTLQNPTDSGTLTALFSCDRRVYATCQVSGQPAEPCNYPFGIFKIDVRQLSRGPHLFILSVDDGFGRTLIKAYPFSLGMAHRLCCPRLDESLSSLTLLDNLTNVLLDLRVSAGNCSENEGFSYSIDWGDGAMQTGSTIQVGPIMASNYYPKTKSASSSTSQSTRRLIRASYCNNPVSLESKCCDELTFRVGK